jgi:hypothetical protein
MVSGRIFPSGFVIVAIRNGIGGHG